MAYVTVQRPAEAEIVVRKSRFIAHVAPVRSESEAWAFVEQIRERHREATHNVFAFKSGSVQRLSDDGEPSGTAGRPVFAVVENRGLTDTVVVVTRYFGGILLGAGGLVRAYSQAAVAGVEAAGIAQAVPAVDLKLTIDYTALGKVQYLIQQTGALTLETEFSHDVILTCRVLAAGVDECESALVEATSGRIRINRLGELLVGPDLHPL